MFSLYRSSESSVYISKISNTLTEIILSEVKILIVLKSHVLSEEYTTLTRYLLKDI